MILKYSVHPRVPGESATVRRQRELLDLPDLESWRDYYIEVGQPPAEEAAAALRAALGDPLTETVRVGEPIEPGRMVQVTYKRGIVDNENDSIVAFSQLFGVEAVHARVGTTYVSADPALAERVRAQLVNPNIEELHEAEPAYETLGPQGSGAPPERFDLCAMSDEQLAAVGTADGRNLNLEQMRLLRRIQEELGLASVTDVLIEAADARWSDHCLHTTWKSLGNLLGKLKDASRRTANPNILSMFGDNAGVWDFYDGWAIALKGETHSGPSAVSAYFGQLTKLGGVLRDILGTGLGADPIGSFEYTATGPADAPSPIPGRPSPRQIARETVRAIKEYGNTFGVPMMRAHMTFHPDYVAKPFALGGSIGLIPVEAAQRGEPQPGDLLMLIGGLTGNDGIHGASASSAGSEMDEASVQIGSPLEEVAFRQAIVDLRDAGCLRALTDVGGAGLNSAVGEIGDPGGVWLNTALVPLKTAGLPAWRILLSESQERMLLAVIPERLEAARELLERHRVRHTVIGRFTEDGRYTVVHLPEVEEAEVVAADALPADGEAAATGFSVPYELLEYEPPQRDAPAPPAADADPVAWPALDRAALAALVPRVLADPEVASQRFATCQYDTTVMGLTAYGPGLGPHHVPTSYWAGTPLPGSPAAVLFATAFDPWLFERHPVRALRQLFLRIVGTLVLAGAAVEDVCLCDNFYTPHLHPDGDAWLVGMVDELAALVERFGTPVISGKDSSAGSVATPEGIVHVPPAVFLSALGKVPDRARLRRNEWTAPGNLLVRIGPDTESPGGTVAGRLLGLPAAPLDEPDLDAWAAYLDALRAVPEGVLASARPIGSGGTLAALVLGEIASGLGAELDARPGDDLAWLLAEHRCGALAEVPEAALDDLPDALAPRVVGRVTDRPASLRLDGEELGDGALETWTTSWEALLR